MKKNLNNQFNRLSVSFSSRWRWLLLLLLLLLCNEHHCVWSTSLKISKTAKSFSRLIEFFLCNALYRKGFSAGTTHFLNFSSLFCFPSHPFFPAINSGKWLGATCSLRVIHALPKAINCMYLHLENVTRVSKQLNGHKMIVRCILWIVVRRDAERVNKRKHRNLRYKNGHLEIFIYFTGFYRPTQNNWMGCNIEIK